MISTVVLLFLRIAVMVKCSSVPESWDARVLGPRAPEIHIPTEKAASVTDDHNLVCGHAVRRQSGPWYLRGTAELFKN